MIRISKLIEQLWEAKRQHGDVGVILQQDPEGNGYYAVRGGEIGFLTEDHEYAYADLDEAIADGNDFEDLTRVLVIYP